MSFTTIGFCIFLLCLLLGYFTVFRRFQWQFLLLASFAFYAFSGWENLVYIAITIVSTWLAGQHMSKLRTAQKAYFEQNPDLSKPDKKAYKAAANKKLKRWLIACLLFNFTILAVVKYANFAIANLNAVSAAFDAPLITPIDLLLPMGISFYIFQSMGYIIDVYRGGESESNLFRLGLFVSFFPQLIQGPISRFGDLKQTLFTPHKFDGNRFQTGLARMMWGFFKKLIVADRLFAAVAVLSRSPEEYAGIYVLWNALFYAITLYADFTGGIDITIGAAHMLGIDVKENFNRPFYAVNIADYWRRWHISMGTWFKDYVFYPVSASQPMLKLFKWSKKHLGDGFGKRVSVYVSTMILWFATGIWHGAEWHFIVWGLVNGIVIILSEECSPLYARFHARFPVGKTAWYRAFQIVRTFWLMSFIRIFDVYANVRTTFKMWLSVLTDFGWARFLADGFTSLGLAAADYAVIGISVLVMILVGYAQYNRKVLFLSMRPAVRGVLLAAMAMAVVVFGIYGFGYDSRQFIYNQF